MASIAQLITFYAIQSVWWLFVTISVAVFGLAERLLRFVLSPNFINVSYTTNDFVTLGWTLTRDFANIFFIIILVIIGLATALRIREYQWQKALPLLIGIALLINFTPVILGLIIDASNIVMNFFIEGIAPEEGYFSLRMQTHLTSVINMVGKADWTNPGSYFAILIAPAVYVIFNLIAAIIYSLFAILFVLRYVALWTLVILSPIAFLCYILPHTRGIFSLWWNQFLQWCIIGVAAAFILYLGDHLLYFIMGGGFVGEGNQEGWGLANQIVPYFVILGFLLFGFFAALSTSAMGATAVITAAQKGVKTAGTWTAKTGAKFGLGTARRIPAVSRAEERIRKRLETIPLIGRTVGGPGAYERGKRGTMDKLGKPFEKLAPQEIRKALRVFPITNEDKLKQARLFEILKEKGELSNDERRYIPMAQKMGLNINEVLQRRVDWAPDFGMTTKEAMAKIEPRDFYKNIQKEALRTPEVVYHLMLDEMKFNEMERKGSAAKKLEIKRTFQTNPLFAEANLPPEHRQLMKERAARLSLNRRWFSTSEELKSEEKERVRGGIVLPGTKEFRETKEEIRRRTR